MKLKIDAHRVDRECVSTHLKRVKRPADERGAVIVEAALVLPVMILLVIGIIEFGLLYANSSTATASTRSGARLAATMFPKSNPSANPEDPQVTALNQIVAATSADLQVLNNAEPVGMAVYRVATGSSSGAPGGGYPGENMVGGCTSSCIKYTWNGTKMVKQSGSWPSPERCAMQNVDSIGIYVQVRHDYLTGFFGSSRTVNAHTVMRLEPVPADSC